MTDSDHSRAGHVTVDKWRESEYQSLIKHFEEIYKLSATSVTVLVAGCGAVLAYAGISLINLAIVCVLVLLWYAAFLAPIRLYTFNVLGRLATLEQESKYHGHFNDWKTKVDGDTWGIKYTGTLWWALVALLAAGLLGYFLIAAFQGYNPLPPPIEASVLVKTTNGEVQFKTSVRPDQLETRVGELVQRANALSPAKTPSPASPPGAPKSSR